MISKCPKDATKASLVIIIIITIIINVIIIDTNKSIFSRENHDHIFIVLFFMIMKCLLSLACVPQFPHKYSLSSPSIRHHSLLRTIWLCNFSTLLVLMQLPRVERWVAFLTRRRRSGQTKSGGKSFVSQPRLFLPFLCCSFSL